MSVADFLYIIAVFADIALVFMCCFKLAKLHDDSDSRCVVMSLITGIAMLAMHTLQIGTKPTDADIQQLAWQLLQVVIPITMLNSLRCIK